MKRYSLLLALAIAGALCSCKPAEHKIAITAHQGYWTCEEAGYTGNTVASLREAQNQDLWGSEFDVHITADGGLIVNHDNDIQGINIHDTTLAAFADLTLKNGEHPATIDAFLSQAEKSATTTLVYELKPNPSAEQENLMVDKTIEALKAHNLYDPARVIFISFSMNVCKRIAELCPEFTNQYLGGDVAPDALHTDGINGIDYHFNVFFEHPDWVELAHSLGMSVNAWTIDDEENMQKIIDLGVDCITTNEPLRLRALLGDKELKLKK